MAEAGLAIEECRSGQPPAEPGGGVLVFPAGMEAARRFARAARRDGRRVVGASSLAYEPARADYREWLALPYVTEPGFEAALRAALAGAGLPGGALDEIYTPHPVIAERLERLLPELAPGVRLTAALPDDALARQRARAEDLAALRAAAWELAVPPIRPALGEAELLGLFSVLEEIPGHCSDEKLWALLETLRRCPPGDIVEIGSAWGRSAFALGWAAQRQGLGPLLCVDPWSAAERFQNDAGGAVNAWAGRMDFDATRAFFESRLALLPRGSVNALAMTSEAGAARYRADRRLETPAFGATDYRGAVALLHIDGNHDEAYVARDLEGWGDLVVPGGWLVFDDYRWAFGEGPRRVGDRYLFGRPAAAAFVAGTALFVQRPPERP